MLNRVTVTGADDSTPLGWLDRVGCKYPWVEWGILLSETSRGGPRFPSREWLDRLSNMPLTEHNELDFSAHLCGAWVRRAIKGDWGFVEQIGPAWHLFDRVQLNFHAYTHLVDPEPFHESLRQLGKQAIFQVDGCNDHLVSHAYDAGCDVAALYDKSGGAGILPDTWPSPMAGIYSGYAGGLGAGNVGAELSKIEKVLMHEESVWIDAETRLRVSDNSSLNETCVLEFLEGASPWIDENPFDGKR